MCSMFRVPLSTPSYASMQPSSTLTFNSSRFRLVPALCGQLSEQIPGRPVASSSQLRFCQSVKRGTVNTVTSPCCYTGEAVTRGHVNVCRVLAAGGAAGPNVMSDRINGGFTLLHLAAGAGAAATVEWLLERTNAQSLNDVDNEEGLSPLHCSVLGGNLNYATIEKLMNCGADATVTCAALAVLAFLVPQGLLLLHAVGAVGPPPQACQEGLRHQ